MCQNNSYFGNNFGNTQGVWLVHIHLGKNRRWFVLLMLIVIMLLAACGGNAPAAASPATAPAATTEPAVAAAPTAATAENSTVQATETTSQTTAMTSTASGESSTAQANGATGSKTFAIDPAQSEVRFSLTEVLMGQDATAIGRGNGIQGNVTVDFDDYSKSSISPVVIDATQLATDSNMRNGMIRRAILQSSNPDYHDITFKPAAISGLPGNVTIGQSFNISVTGDLTIRGVTKPLTFAVTVTPVSQSQIKGSAAATLMRDDFDLKIPSVPTVADVSQAVQLAFDFVANAQ